jgi:hypothetical protein
VQTQTFKTQIVSRIYGNQRGWTFSQKDFADLAGRSMADWTLFRLEETGTIRRVLRGLYEYPRYSELLQAPLTPDIDKVAQALARKFGWRIQPNGELALNRMGLSTQVPGRAVYLSDGPTRRYTIGQSTLEFRHTKLKEAGFKHAESGLIVQALRSLGQERIDAGVIAKIRAWLPEKMRAKVRKDTQRATAWVYEAIVKITEPDE